jgi:hypothetical protein
MLSGDSITKQLVPGIVKRGEEFVADQSSQPIPMGHLFPSLLQ